jgi:hypothetical protein
MNSNTSAIFTLGLNSLSKNMKYVQFQLSFTDYDGLRKVRVLNHSFNTGIPQQFYSGFVFDTIFCALCKVHICDGIYLENYLIKAISYYRTKISTTASPSQFVLPDSLNCLPVLIQSFSKKYNKDKAHTLGLNVEQCLRYFYPRLLCLSDYDGLAQTPCIRLSINNIQNNEINILEDSQIIFIYIGAQADQMLISRLVDLDTFSLRVSEDEECKFLQSIIEEINLHYNYKLNVRVILSGKSKDEAEFLGNMVEDAIDNCGDYVDFIFKMHFQVQKEELIKF